MAQSDQADVAATLTTMPGVPAQFECAQDRAEFQRPAHRAGLELYRAHIVRHAFDPHTHQAFGIGAIESGVERFRYAGSEHLAAQDSVVLMNPDVLHTGRAETEGGWRYRMLYIDPDLLAQFSGETSWSFDDAVCNDVHAARQVAALLNQMWQADDALAVDSALSALLTLCRRYARTSAVRPEASLRFAPVLDYMRANLSERITLDDLAAVIDISPFHFLRCFQKQYHVTPQQMLMALRLFDAKRLLATGLPPAQVAAACGLSDQAHLTRAFVRRYGVTPARYQQQVRASISLCPL